MIESVSKLNTRFAVRGFASRCITSVLNEALQMWVLPCPFAAMPSWFK